MNTIKVRAWDKKYKKMYYGGDIRTALVFPDKEIEYMLFARKCDINEKEIFESDIVKHKNGEIYLLSFCNINLWWYLGPIRSGFTAIKGQDMRLHMCEVIGNIHENPELLKC